MEQFTKLLKNEEEKMLEQNSVCVYCNSRNTYFLRYFLTTCRINKKGEPICMGKNNKPKSLKTKSELEVTIKSLLDNPSVIINSIWVVCKNCGKTRKITQEN